MQYELSIRNKGLHNLSKKKLSRNETNVLSRGLKFVIPDPFNRSNPAQDISTAWNSLILSLRSLPYSPDIPLKVHSKKSSSLPNPSAIAYRLKSNPEFIDHFNESYIFHTSSLMNNFIRTINNNPQLRSIKNSVIPKCETNALENLVNNKKIVVKPADKNLGLCIVDTEWYNNEMLSQLKDRSTYHLIPDKNRESTLKKHSDHIKKELSRSWLKTYLANNEYKFLQDAAENLQHAQAPHIYLLIKMHKNPIAGRPIIPSLKSMTTDISKWLDWKLQPLAKKYLPTIVYSSQAIVQDLEHLKFPSDCILATADISSLFTKIPTDQGIAAIRDFLSEANVESHLIDTIAHFLRIVLENNLFYYKNTLYLQVQGTAMGTPVAPAYANIFVGWLETNLVNQLKMEKILLYYKRYIDDTLFVFANIDEPSLKVIKHRFNRLNSNIVFNFELSRTSVSFLDLFIFKGNRFHDQGIFDIRTHKKQMNLHLYVPFTSFQPIHQKLGLVKTELIRYIRNSSSRSDYIQTKIEFFEYLRLRGYPTWFLNRASKSAWYKDRSSYLYPQVKQDSEITRIHLFKVPFNKITSRVNFKRHLMTHYDQFKQATNKRIVVCFKNGKRLLSKLTRNIGPPYESSNSNRTSTKNGGTMCNNPNKTLLTVTNPPVPLTTTSSSFSNSFSHQPRQLTHSNPCPAPTHTNHPINATNSIPNPFTSPLTSQISNHSLNQKSSSRQKTLDQFFTRDKTIKKSCVIS